MLVGPDSRIPTQFSRMIAMNETNRFWARVNKTEHCWLWVGYTDRDGYGKHWLNGTTCIVHRWAYENYVGPIPKGMTIDHMCKTRNCVNVAHLRILSAVDNIRMGSPGRYNKIKTHCKYGHEFTVSNTRVYKTSRHCKTCCNNRMRHLRKTRRHSHNDYRP